MKRLLKSSKFWLAVIGSIFSIIAYILSDQISLSYWILGAFTSVIIGNAAEDTVISYKSGSIPGGGLPPPEKDPKEDED